MAASRFTTFLETFDPDPKKRGTQWEHVCKCFLETDPVYRAQLKKVWHWDKWPGRTPRHVREVRLRRPPCVRVGEGVERRGARAITMLG